jgi:3',5'-cyclic AMP phosphodiesterase CpdA
MPFITGNKFCVSSILLAVMSWAVLACGGGGGEDPIKPSADSFKIIVLSDVHVRLPGNPDDTQYDNAGNLARFTEAINRIKNSHADADLVVVTGDLTGCLFSDNPDDYGVGQDNPAERFKSMIETLGKPYYVILGNHDYLKGFDTTRKEGIPSEEPTAMEAVWKKVLGIDPYYAFVHKGVRFIMLNSTRGPSYNNLCPTAKIESGCKGSFDNEQMDWLQGELAHSEPCLIFLHHPVVTDHIDTKYRSAGGAAMQLRSDDRFYTIARSNKNKIKGIFVGHGHRMVKDTLETVIPVHETASIGDNNGSSSNIRVVWMDPYTGVMLTD